MYPFPIEFFSMKFKEYIDRTHAFTNAQLVSNCDLAEASIKTMLKRALAAGQIERARRGLYVSKTGRFASAAIDSFEVVSAADPNAVVSFHSALEAHGVAHNIAATCQFRSAVVKGSFEYSGVSYMPFPLAEGLPARSIRGRESRRVNVTTREQTIVDCLKHAGRCGGIEEVLMSLSLFPYIDADVLLVLVSSESASLAARIGWLLEQKADAWRISDAALAQFEQLAKGGPCKLDKDSVKTLGWSRRWKLCLPASEEEIRQWLQGKEALR